MSAQSPVGQELLRLLSHPQWGPEEWDLMGKFQRKLDIGRQLFQQYDLQLKRPVSDQTLDAVGYATMVALCVRAFESSPLQGEFTRGNRLAWINTAWYAFDRLMALDAASSADWRDRLESVTTQASTTC